VRRRQFITLLGGAGAWLLAGRAGQAAMPTIGMLLTGTAEESKTRIDAFRQGLSETGHVEGRNVAIEHRYADNHYDRLTELAAELVRLPVAVLFASGGGGVAPQAAKASTSVIPTVFAGGFDPVQAGLVASLNRPGGNVTGVTFLTNRLEVKRLGLLHEMLPQARLIAVIVNPDNASVEREIEDLTEAARSLSLVLRIARANNVSDFEPAFADFVHAGADGLIVASDAFLTNQSAALVALASRYKLPAIHGFPDFPEAGGLASYGTSLTDAFRLCGSYVGRILNGEKPGDLPVVQSTKFNFVLNLKTAKALRLTIPPGLLAIVDEVIE
jgi:putative tryptophan/tyrosine transport system substrate-binding protein